MKIVGVIVGFAWFLLASCAEFSAVSDGGAAGANSLSAPETARGNGPRLYIFDCGFLEFENYGKQSVDDKPSVEAKSTQLFVPCYLVEHDGQRLFWDGGLPLSMAGRRDIALFEGVTARYDRSVIEQLADIGLSPDDIDLVAFSHMHLDHAGSGNAFSGSTLLIQRAEYQYAFVNYDQASGVLPKSYLNMSNARRVTLDGNYDVFGDGRVRLISAPGHTPGHQLLWLDLENTGPLLLSGDLYHNQQSRRERHVPEINTDREQTLASMDRTERLLEETGATLWISHDPELASRLKLSPEYYD